MFVHFSCVHLVLNISSGHSSPICVWCQYHRLNIQNYPYTQSERIRLNDYDPLDSENGKLLNFIRIYIEVSSYFPITNHKTLVLPNSPKINITIFASSDQHSSRLPQIEACDLAIVSLYIIWKKMEVWWKKDSILKCSSNFDYDENPNIFIQV